jgi:hypothetical protein
MTTPEWTDKELAALVELRLAGVHPTWIERVKEIAAAMQSAAYREHFLVTRMRVMNPERNTGFHLPRR